MPHFYGKLQGYQGEATRQGGKESGIYAQLQTWSAKARIDLDHIAPNGEVEKTDVLTISFGSLNGYSRNLLRLHNIDLIAAQTEDPKVDVIIRRINELGATLEKTALAAAKRKDKDDKKRKQEQERMVKARVTLRAQMPAEEKARLVRLIPSVELDKDGNFEDCSIRSLEMANLRRGEDGRSYAEISPIGTLQIYTFDVSTGEWLMPNGITPADLGIAAQIEMTGYGWRHEEER